MRRVSEKAVSQSYKQTNRQKSEEIDDHTEMDSESTNDKTDKQMKHLNFANSDTLSEVTAQKGRRRHVA